MTGHFVDREHHARAMERNRAILEQMAAQPGQMGVTARLGLATIASDDWADDEIERGTTEAQIVIASIERAASLVIARIAGMNAAGRETCLGALFGTIQRGFDQFDAMSAEELDAASVKTNPRQ